MPTEAPRPNRSAIAEHRRSCRESRTVDVGALPILCLWLLIEFSPLLLGGAYFLTQGDWTLGLVLLLSGIGLVVRACVLTVGEVLRARRLEERRRRFQATQRGG